MRGGARAGGAAVGLLLLTPSAAAHVTVSPTSLEQGATVVVALGTPNEREGHTTVALAVELPPQVEIVSAVAPAGWVVEHTENTVTWSGGAIAGADAVEFPLELRGIGPVGAVELEARQRYEDGFVTTWQPQLTLTPATGDTAPPSHLGRATVAAVAGLVVVAASLLLVHRLRRRPV
jgi:uncharacterized protein YcnI